MPSAPPTVCGTCGGLKRQGICSKCGQKRGNHPRKTSERGYGWDWQTFRRGYLQQHPLCMDCFAEDITTAATEVHHVVKIKDRPSMRLEATNCMALCDYHHNQRSAKGE